MQNYSDKKICPENFSQSQEKTNIIFLGQGTFLEKRAPR